MRQRPTDAVGPSPTAPLDRGTGREPASHRHAGPRTGRAGEWKTAAAVASYLGAAVVIYAEVWSSDPSTHMQVGADQISTVWFLSWIPFAVLHGHNPFFAGYGNYPFGVNVLVNTSVPLLGLVGTPVTLLFGPIATYNLACTLALAGSATAGYFFARRWTRWRGAAWACGLLYGFSPYEIAQSNGGHLDLTFVVLPPLIFLALHEVAERQRWSARSGGVVLGLLITAQFFVSSEVLASTVVIGGVCVLAAAVFGHRSVRVHLHHAAVSFGWAAAVAGALLAYPVWFALQGPAHINGAIQLVPEAYRADMLGPLVPSAYVWLAPPELVHTADAFANSASENGSYLGVTLILTLVIGTLLLWRRSAVVRVCAVGGLAAFLLSLGGALVVRSRPGIPLTGPPLPERIFTKVPVLSNMVPARYSLYVTLFAGLALALILDHLHAAWSLPARNGRRPTPWAHVRPVVPSVIAVVCLVPLIPNLPFQSIGDMAAPPYFTSAVLARTEAGSVTVIYPYPSVVTPSGQLWQALGDMQVEVPGGYFLVPYGNDRDIGFSPELSYGAQTLSAQVFSRVYKGAPPAETTALRRAVLAQFSSWHVSRVVASFTGVPEAAVSRRFLTWLAGEPPVHVLGVDVWSYSSR